MMEQESFMIILIGATGDLAKKKLIPSLYNLFIKGILHQRTPITCVATLRLTTAQFLPLLELDTYLPNADPESRARFISLIEYRTCNFTPDCQDLFSYLEKRRVTTQISHNKIFYLATPPRIFGDVAAFIHSAQLKEGWQRIAFEKPFGHDLSSARLLHQQISSYFTEEQTYRIDHYLGKALVQDLFVLRFSNAIFDPIWNGQFIDNVQITISEAGGVDKRGGYYDHAGAIRDMVQNHVLQLLALVAMERPASTDAQAIRDEKVKIFRQLLLPKNSELVVGQYEGYRQEEKVALNSSTETFIATKIMLANPRWQGVPFYIRTGKKMEFSYAQIDIQFKELPSQLFAKNQMNYSSENRIQIRIQPNTGVSVVFNINEPGAKLRIRPVVMDFCHRCQFAFNTPEAYEFLFSSMIEGDQTMFTRWDEIESCWQFVDQLKQLAGEKTLASYQCASNGPIQSNKLLQDDGRNWIGYDNAM